MTETGKLLAVYVADGSEDAFRELVRRYVDLVHSTAVRLVEGDTHLAADVTQLVFLNLARKAADLPGDIKLGGWLHRDTCFTASKMLRRERRRRIREQKAVEMNLIEQMDGEDAPISSALDAAVNQLREEDREAILLRFYEKRDFQAVGEAMGTSENAAQKRVSRALEQLRRMLKGRGVSIGEVALAAFLTEKAVVAAPAAVVGAAAVTALAGASEATVSLGGMIVANKFVTGVVCAVLAANVVTPILLHRHAAAKLQEQEATLRGQANEIAKLTTEIDGTAQRPTRESSAMGENDDFLRLMRMRGLVGELRREVTRLEAGGGESREQKLALMAEQYAGRIAELKNYLEEHPAEAIPELHFISDENWLWLAGERTGSTEEGYQLAMSLARLSAEGNVSREIFRPALMRYAEENGGRFPTAVTELERYVEGDVPKEIFQRWQVIQAKKLTGLVQNLHGEDWVITQRAPVNPLLDQRIVLSLNNYRMFASARPEHWAVER